jgi:superfamily II DNA helicase RecQ
LEKTGENMPLLTQFRTFFISPFGEAGVCDELNKFLSSNRIVDVEKRLIDGERGTGWLFLVEYGNENKTLQTSTSSSRIDYREILNEQEFALYDKLRQLRKSISDEQKVPPYVVFNNEQLASMVKSPPASVKDIAKLPGVGEAKVKQYGARFLRFFAEQTEQTEMLEAEKREKK